MLENLSSSYQDIASLQNDLYLFTYSISINGINIKY